MAQIFSAIDAGSVHVSTDIPGMISIHPHFFQVHLHNTELGDVANAPLYKFYSSIRTLSYVLANKMLFIDRVESWDDSYENFFLKERFYSRSMNAIIHTNDAAHSVFGQSWTMIPESDALWRIYSSDKKGIRIQTTSNKLFSAIMVDNQSIADTWFGKVEYGSLDEINNYIRKECETDGPHIWQQLMPYCQFIKRNEFEHEHEFRVIKMLESRISNSFKNHERLAFSINPDDFIESYLLDPRLKEDEYDALKSELIKQGVNPMKISKSQLYEFKPIQIELD